MTKPKRIALQDRSTSGRVSRVGTIQRKLDKARRDHAAGTLGTDDYIWTVMQCYAAESRHNGKG